MKKILKKLKKVVDIKRWFKLTSFNAKKYSFFKQIKNILRKTNRRRLR